VLKVIGKGASGTISRNLVVLYPLGRGDQCRVYDGPGPLGLNDLRAFFDKTFHCVARFATEGRRAPVRSGTPFASTSCK
jgi:hypothetical protein